MTFVVKVEAWGVTLGNSLYIHPTIPVNSIRLTTTMNLTSAFDTPTTAPKMIDEVRSRFYSLHFGASA
jgi:hypothetical protein